MLHGHAAYVSGAVQVHPPLPASLMCSLIYYSTSQEQIGNLTSSTAWQESGQSAKTGAVDEMRSAKQASDAAKLASHDGETTGGNPTVGMVEQKLGAVTGCEGMEQEGLEKQKK